MLTVSAVILAGGQSRRMQGQDKGLMPLGAEPVAGALARMAAAQVAQVWINTHGQQQPYQALGYPLLADSRAGFCGPLAGIEAALAVSSTSHVWVIPCDMPRVDASCLATLVAGWRKSQSPWCYLARKNPEGPQHSLCALVQRSVAQALSAYLDEGHRAIKPWLEHVQAHGCWLDSDEHWHNLNTQAQWQQFLKNEQP